MRKLYAILAVTAVLTALAAPSIKAQSEAAESPESVADARVRALIGALTLEEKVSLMMHHAAPVERLGIGRYNWWNEALHGVARNGSATVFPQPIGMAAAFDAQLLEEIFTAVSDEARVKNRIAREAGEFDIYKGVTFWTPNINIFRDPRWGRGMETYGEDPYLTAVLGCAVVRGLQGDMDSEVLKTHACAKHFAVHSGPESTRHSYDARVSERDLRETYLPAFKALVTKAQVQEVMTAYNRFEGEPCAASGRLVKDILRGEWGYKGLIVSDCWALSDFYVEGRHGFTETAAEAAALAVKNGVDVECGEVYHAIPEAVALGLLEEEEVDRCLYRQLMQRFRIGEMEGKSLWDDLPDDMLESEEHRALSLRIAREGMVLLQNRDGILPLAADAKVALVGPNADDAAMQWGNYNPVPESTVTLLDALRERLGEVRYVRACGLVARPEECGDKYLIPYFEPDLDVRAVLDSLEGFETIIFAGGISPVLEGEEMDVPVPGFAGGDRESIELPEVQRILLRALHDAGKKVVLVNYSGSAVGLVPETESCDAILQAWYPGQDGGTAVADIIYGDVNPSGKLPVTFYKSVDQLPDFENYDMEGHTYRYFRGRPLFAFGHGLSYTTFKYGRAHVRRGCLQFKVRNTGTLDGSETVQLYLSRPDDADGPVRTLRHFCRIYVPAGKSVKVRIPLTAETFEWWSEEAGDVVPLAGKYLLWYGGSSDESALMVKKYNYKSR